MKIIYFLMASFSLIITRPFSIINETNQKIIVSATLRQRDTGLLKIERVELPSALTASLDRRPASLDITLGELKIFHISNIDKSINGFRALSLEESHYRSQIRYKVVAIKRYRSCAIS